ncbi:hypothetical protein GCM10023317_25730 [Actinopolymorpha pittospori]|uniref:(2Fe-2S) ferredoxin n=1 Tax=Actinopolymorpha pittospori TaxID=648752 RepID=A0A927MMU4_9ACTN|nr:(2Fe-2S) ferredoxin [Actinopolymorpha pittospori]
MARREISSPAAHVGASCTVTVCRGCCCGTAKVSRIDHAAQLARLCHALGSDVRVRLSGCLDVCAYGNVLVVQPSATGRTAGGRPMWLGLVNDLEVVDVIAAWVRAGGPGLVEPSDVLALYAFTPSRRLSQALSS